MSVASVFERLSPAGVRQRPRRSAPASRPEAAATPSDALDAPAEAAEVAAAAPPATPAQPDSATAARLDWVDMARAGAVVAVVLFHACIGHYWAMDHAKAGAIPWWDRVNQIVTAVRMPLLFTISGMLAAGKIRRGFRRGKAIEAAVTNYYLYVVWLLVFGGMLLLAGDRPVPFQVDTLSTYLREFYLPNSPLWYVFALALYILGFTALRRVPGGLVLGVLLGVHLVATQLYTLESPLWTRGLSFALYFGLGVYGRRIMRAVATRPILAAVAAAGAYLVYQQIGMSTLMSLQVPTLGDAALTMALYVFAGLAMVGITGLLARVRPYASVGRAVGRRTLGIYVLHIPVIVVIDLTAWGPFGALRDLAATSPTVDTIYPLLITACVVPICMACQDLAPRLGLGFLFEAPGWLRENVESARTRLIEARPVQALDEARRVTV